MIREVHSPTATDAPLEYLTVEAYQWPKQERAKRHRMEVDERRRRHREDQRRFMIRKQQRVEALRREAALAEMHFRLVWALREEQILLEERRQIDQLKTTQATSAEAKVPPPLTPLEETDPAELDPILSDLLLSL